MKLVHDRADALWLPSRFRFAVFRIFAWITFRASPPRPREGLVLAIDRDQSAIESYTVTIWLVANWICFAFAWLGPYLPWPAAAILAILAAIVVPQVIVTVGGLGPLSWRQQNHIELNSFFQMFALTLVATYFAGVNGWPGIVGRTFLATLVLNACAAVVIRLLPEPEMKTV